MGVRPVIEAHRHLATPDFRHLYNRLEDRMPRTPPVTNNSAIPLLTTRYTALKGENPGDRVSILELTTSGVSPDC